MTDRTGASEATPDGERAQAWLLLATYGPLFGLLFLIGTENFIVSPLIPAMARELDRPVTALATVVTAYALTYAVLAPVFGSVADRVGRAPMIIAGSSIFLAGNLLVAAAPTLTVLQVARAVTGLGGAMAGPAIWAYMAEHTAAALRGRVMGIGMGAFSLGQVVGVPAGALVAGLADWRWSFRVIGILILALLAGIALLVARQRASTPPRQAAQSPFLLFTVWGSGQVRLALGATLLFQAANLACYTFLGSLLSSTYHLTTSEIGTTGILVGGGSFIGSLVGGRAIDWWRAKGGRSAYLAVAWAILLGLAILVTTTPLALPVTLVALVLWFVASGAFVTTQQVLLTLAAPDRRATAVSWNNSMLYAGAGIGVWVIGLVLPHGVPIGVMGLTFALAAAAVAALLARIEVTA